MKKRRMWKGGFALAVLLPLGVIAACEAPAVEEPAASAPGQAPMAEPIRPAAGGMGAEDTESGENADQSGQPAR